MGVNVPKKKEKTFEETAEETKKTIDQVLDSKDNLTEEEKKKYRDVLYQTCVEYKPLQDAFGLSQDLMEMMYAQAYQCYSNGQYEKANHIFRTLIFLNKFETKYYLGLAATYHSMKEFENAIYIYISWALLDIYNPLPFYHAADCSLKMDNKIGAFLFLNQVIRRCLDKKEYEQLKHRAATMRDSIKKEINEE